MSTTTKPPRNDASGVERSWNTKAPKAASTRRRFTALELGGALIVALGTALVVNAAFGVANPIAIVVVGYLAFVAVVAIVEMSGERRPKAAPGGVVVDEIREIDLTREADPIGASDVTPEYVVDMAAAGSFLHSVEVANEPDLPDVPTRRRAISGEQIVEAAVAAAAAAGIAEITRIALHMQSIVGLALWWYVAFIVVYFLLARDHDDAEAALDRVVTMLVWSVGVLLIAALAWMITTVVTKGAVVFGWGFLTHDLSETGPLTPGGGALHAIIGTAEQVGLATIVVIPLGILTAVYLHEIRGRIAGPIRFIVDAMSGLPSIVAGLLIYTIWVGGHGFSGAAGSAALVVLMLPTMTRATEEILRTVPDGLREGALALGSPQWSLILRVVLPTALAGIVTASLLAVARAIGETAPMILTAFGSDSVNTNPFHGPQADLPLFVLKLIFQPNQNDQNRAWAGALVLLLLVLVLFVSARLVARRGLKRLGGSR